MSEYGGTKYDDTKPRMDLIPPIVPYAIATVLAHGSHKYSDRNWEKGLSYGRLFGAVQRHLWAFWSGAYLDDGDNGSNLPHLWEALTELAMLVATMEHDLGPDDRSQVTFDESIYESTIRTLESAILKESE